MSLSDIEVRILGALLEKERTTPEGYPLSTNALLNACNQKTSRDPVTDYALFEIEEALRDLQTKGLVRSVQGTTERVVKHQHMLADTFDIRPKDFAVLAVLMLRGPQTPGELRGRTDRYTHFAATADVEESLERLAAHGPPLARNHGRGPGQSQDRWSHTLGFDPERLRPRVRKLDGENGPEPHASTAAGVSPTAGVSPAAAGRSVDAGNLASLRAEVARLRRQVERLLEHAGLSDDDG